MKKRVLAAVLIAITVMGFTPGADKEIDWVIFWQPWEKAALEKENDELRKQLAEANDLIGSVEQVEADVRNLEAQKAGAYSALASVQTAVLQERQELSRLMNASQNMRVAMAQITPEMGEVGRRYFPGAIGTDGTRFNSMAPTFDENDLVFITQDAGYLQTVKVGDVVIAPACNSGGYVIHRVLREEGGGWRLKGDNKPSPDPCVIGKDEVTWKMVAIAKDVVWS